MADFFQAITEMPAAPIIEVAIIATLVGLFGLAVYIENKWA